MKVLLSVLLSFSLSNASELVGSWLALSQSCKNSGVLKNDIEKVSERPSVLSFDLSGNATISVTSENNSVLLISKYAILENNVIVSLKAVTMNGKDVRFEKKDELHIFQFEVTGTILKTFNKMKADEDCSTGDTLITIYQRK